MTSDRGADRPERAGARRRGRVLAAAGLPALLAVLFTILLGRPAAAQERESASREPRVEVGLRPREFEQRVNGIRLAVAGAALLVLLAGARARRRTGGRTDLRLSLALLAAAAFATNYNLFLATRLHVHELFHYYLGAKYFPELGYTDLYRFAFLASPEGEDPTADRSFPITDLRTNQRSLAGEVLPPVGAPTGAAERFSPERWAEFQRDVAWFHRQLGPKGLRTVLQDHGYNASPVWMMLGRPLAEAFPARTRSMWLLARLDLVLLLAGFGALAWAFGVEAACLAVVAWGVNPLARYPWIGDAYLRQLWFAATLIGLALLKRRRTLGAGVALATAALLRIFPASFSLGYVLRHARLALSRRRLARGAVPFLGGALATGVLLLLLSSWVSGQGFGAWRLFASNLSQLTDEVPTNGFGLRYLLALGLFEGEDGGGTVLAARGHVLAGRAALAWLGALGFGVLLWRALGRARDWEAAILGGLLIPVLAIPVGYYTSFLVPLALLRGRRRWVPPALLATFALQGVAVLAWHNEPESFAASSAAGLALVALVLARR